jgi:uncharacterized protein (DUF2147 family)
MKQMVLLSLAALALVLPECNARADGGGDAVLGIWHTSENKSQVRIFKRDNQYFGEVVSLTQPNWPADDKQGMGGKPRTDRNNPKPELRSRPLVGLQFMSGFVYNGRKHWVDGKIYDPEGGNTYTSKMTLLKSGKLELRGYVGFSLFGRTVTWTR